MFAPLSIERRRSPRRAATASRTTLVGRVVRLPAVGNAMKSIRPPAHRSATALRAARLSRARRGRARRPGAGLDGAAS
ncbi:MAG: hypothetical protein MZV49_04355 [Rhodopseudomonas palustris]|nr:hypothetical protein [Rhodopseudomonas palustris]